MAYFSAPGSPARSVFRVEEFLGVDYTNSPAGVDPRRSPDAPNMIRDVPGKVRKCMGWQTVERYEGRINGAHFRRGDTQGLIHAGGALYHGQEKLYSEANDERSRSWQFGENLYLLDGKALLVWDGETVQPVTAAARVPVLTIARPPTGGGTPYEDLNLLQPKFTELFAGTATDTRYHMTFGELDETEVQVQLMQSDGSWVDKAENTDFTVDRAAGIVTFTKAPGVSPVTGEDNVRITAARTVEGYADRVGRCRFGALFGVNGAADRIFAAGNPDFINYDWFCGQNDPTYWPDTGYSVLGTPRSAIVGYSVVNERLAAHKDDKEDGRNVIIRQGNLVDSKPSFPIVNTLQGQGALAPFSFAYLVNEPLFLTKSGVYAITAQDLTGEKYTQNRSFYLNGRLLEEPGLEDAFALVYKDMYWLAVNGQAYILDGLQPLQTDPAAPYATRQYAGFHRTHLPARVLWEQEGALWFGTGDGRVCRFYTDPAVLTSYNDDGEPIACHWDTPDLSGKQFYKNKTFRRVMVRLSSAVATGLTIRMQERGIWKELGSDYVSARYFAWDRLDWSRFSWSGDQTPRLLTARVRLRRLNKSRLRLENDRLNEPFGLSELAVEFAEMGDYRR